MKNRVGITAMSGGISRRSPLEGGAVGEAEQSYKRDTWGGYASRLVEYWGERGVDLTLQDACDTLLITPEELRNNASVQFRKEGEGLDYGIYQDILQDKWRKAAEAIYVPLQNDLRSRVDAIEARFKIGDDVDVNAEVEQIELRIDQITHSEEYKLLDSQARELGNERESAFHESMTANEDEYENAKATHKNIAARHDAILDQLRGLDRSIALLCEQRNALESGTICTLDKFLESLYSVELGDNPLAAAWGKALENCIYTVKNNLLGMDIEDTKVPEIYVGAELFDEFKWGISIHPFIQVYIEQKSDFIQPAFYTRVTVRNHPLFTGVGEK